MSAAESSPCQAAVAMAIAEHGIFGAATLASLIAAIGDHADDDNARMVIQTAFEAAAGGLAAEMAAIDLAAGQPEQVIVDPTVEQLRAAPVGSTATAGIEVLGIRGSRRVPLAYQRVSDPVHGLIWRHERVDGSRVDVWYSESLLHVGTDLTLTLPGGES